MCLSVECSSLRSSLTIFLWLIKIPKYINFRFFRFDTRKEFLLEFFVIKRKQNDRSWGILSFWLLQFVISHTFTTIVLVYKIWQNTLIHILKNTCWKKIFLMTILKMWFYLILKTIKHKLAVEVRATCRIESDEIFWIKIYSIEWKWDIWVHLNWTVMKCYSFLYLIHYYVCVFMCVCNILHDYTDIWVHFSL